MYLMVPIFAKKLGPLNILRKTEQIRLIPKSHLVVNAKWDDIMLFLKIAVVVKTQKINNERKCITWNGKN